MIKKKITWKDIEEQLITLVHSSISLMNKMLHSANLNYIYKGKLYPYRELCFGFLLTARNNSEATLKLMEINLVDQIHFISRNTFEMMVTLYYIDEDKRKRDQLTERFFDYSKVIAHRSMKIMEKYPDIFAEIRTNKDDLIVENDYQDFLNKYAVDKNKRGLLNKWSGISLPDMIETLGDENKNDFMKRYKFMIFSNNNFLHPTALSYRQSIIKHLEGKINYKFRVMQVDSVITSADLIIEKYLEHFPKGRIAFRKELDYINKKRNELVNNAKLVGLIGSECIVDSRD